MTEGSEERVKALIEQAIDANNGDPSGLIVVPKGAGVWISYHTPAGSDEVRTGIFTEEDLGL